LLRRWISSSIGDQRTREAAATSADATAAAARVAIAAAAELSAAATSKSSLFVVAAHFVEYFSKNISLIIRKLTTTIIKVEKSGANFGS
jgi:hypothetical protein